MPAPTLESVRTATQTLSRLTAYLRDKPDPKEAFALVTPLLDEYTGIPVQFGDILRAFARSLLENPDTPRSREVSVLVDELRAAAWEQSDQHTLHYSLDHVRALIDSAAETRPGAQSAGK
ncbi:hypothetical protein G3I60_35845 [Streptomyces sp. SID13666]|uniref:hypothetical protein n=1 Tax=unclassified Streptomyces TaxID=2593676 RepID=UPI0013C26604|nr:MULTISPECIES: hypothetical protein [unclassified Streptomyces]MCZ4103069.1 hypothetical protein [Streptomyces sp. H39-C1]NEA59392.1 hypothetical protein [Streptomyces sp. SID13666]